MASLAELLALVYADVRDVATRAVYADALLELGDPRGELIALQLARGRTGGEVTARERELIAAHGVAWLGAIGRALDETQTRFQNGFLDRARLHRYPLTAALVDHAEWSTLEYLDVSYALHDEATDWAIGELIARLPQLLTLDTRTRQLGAIRARVRGHALERLAVSLDDADAGDLHDLLEARTFDRLQRLRLSMIGAELADDVIRAAQLAGAIELEVMFGPNVGRLAYVVERAVPHVRALTVRVEEWGQFRATLAQGALVLQLFEPRVMRSAGLRAVLDALNRTDVVVRLPPGIPPHAAPELAGFRVEPT